MEENKLTGGIISVEELSEVSGGTFGGPSIVYTVQRGDTLKKIADRYCTTVEILVQINNITDKNSVYAGHELLIPAR